METLFQDVRYALRALHRSPGFALGATLTLALGIGANAAIFTVVNALLLRPLPFPEADRLVSVWPETSHSKAMFEAMREQTGSLDDLAAYGTPSGFSLTGGGEPERLEGTRVSAGLFRVLGVGAVHGRGFVAGEDGRGAEPVVVLGHGLWQRRFGGEPSVVGRRIALDGVDHTVVGVMPPEFHFPSHGTQLWVPLSLDPGDPMDYGGTLDLHLVGRVRRDVTLEDAGADVAAAALEVRGLFPWDMPDDFGRDAGVVSLQERMVGAVRPMLLVLLGAVGLVLLIACVNVANLLLARAAGRQKELAIRASLGAGQGRLVRQLLTESVLLAGLGGAAGLVLASGGVQAALTHLPLDLPRAAEIGVDRQVLGFTLLLALATGVGFGLVPALRTSRADLQAPLRAAAAGSGGGAGQQKLSGVLVAAEVALAVVLVTGAGLLIQSLARLERVDPGFRAENVVTARVSPPEASFTEGSRRQELYGEVLERVRALPGVEVAAAVSRVPLGGELWRIAFDVEGQPALPGTPPRAADDWRITPDYLDVMGIPLLGGRAFTEADDAAGPDVALVNEALARSIWPGEDPVGRRIRPVWWRDRWITVVGVVGNVKHAGLAGGDHPGIYRPFAQEPATAMTLVVRSLSDDLRPLMGAMRRTVASVHPDVPVSEVGTMRGIVAVSVARPRMLMVLLSGFAAMAVLLGAIGIYSVIAYTVSRRTREIGVRLALGAARTDVARMVVRQGATFAGIGIAVGLVAAFAATRVLDSLLFGVGTHDPLTFAVVPLLLLGVALLASWLPARRAARVEPTVAWREE